MTTKRDNQITVVVTAGLRNAFDIGEIRGQGGFQSLMRETADRVRKSGGVVRFTKEEFQRITRYATTYGEGGFQQRLRLLVSQWAAQSFTPRTPKETRHATHRQDPLIRALAADRARKPRHRVR